MSVTQTKKQTESNEPMLIGLTGNIGSGKSTVAGIIKEMGIPCISSDEIVHELYAKDTELQKFLIDNFGSLDKKEIARQIFGKTEEKITKRKLLESEVHPKVEKYLKNWVQENKKHKLLVNDVPLLFEANLEARFSGIIFIEIDEKLQLSRIQKRNPEMSSDEIQNRINSQMPQKIKKNKSDYIILNNSTLTDLIQNVENTVNLIRNANKI
ncbi:MAG: dephospho-CoA kinase [Candidatus Caenarcaniphilales bacterium]|nr:dephospho-CoA kinase [Candidatus Caenarcaniphilales bacterium]